MTKSIHERSVEDLRHEGYAVIVWTPEELRGAPPRKVEDASIEQGWDVIDCLVPDEVEEVES